ncbi:MAG: glycosyltransferase [Nocardiaceae bacterium]|nr:glycosyltransferase [Nocardiaceae bacterium]
MSRSPARIVVVVPAHNEARRLPQCLESIQRARRQVPVPVTVVVVLDNCADGTTFLPGAVDLVVSVRAGCVGEARAAGFDAADIEDAWLVCTDADCIVAEDWLARHYAHAVGGARVVCGTVEVNDWSDLGATARARFEARYRSQPGHGHVHGANMGFRSADYSAVGGFAPIDSGEDVDLVGRFQDSGVPIVWAADLPVTTSARTTGRAPDGFASHLRQLGDARGLESAEAT